MRLDRKRFPSLKRQLVSLNIDIDNISNAYRREYSYGILTPLERHVVALEDKRYFSHCGFDWRSIAREIWRAMTLRKHGGASTIEMQFIRTVTGRYEHTSRRKMREVILSLIVQFHFNKIATLRSYLDVAFFGSGLTGAEAAAQKVFAKDTLSLSDHEAAFIAAMLVYPRPLKPTASWEEKVKRRADYSLRITAQLKEMFDKIKAAEI